MKPARLALSAFLAACMAACTASGPPDPCRLTYVGQVPLWRYGSRLVVPVLINRNPVALMLDTGGAVSLMSAPHAGLLKLRPAVIPPQPTPPTLTGLGGSRTAHVMLTESMRLGTLQAASVPFVVPDQDASGRSNHDPDTLGMNFLAGFDLDVDVLSQRLVFYKAGQACIAPRVLIAPPLYRVLDVYGARQARPIVIASIGGLNVRALLDTGSPQSVLFRPAAERLGIDASTLAHDPRTRLNGIGPTPVDAVRHVSEPIHVGRLTISRMRINVSPESDPDVDVVLGIDFLSKVHLWISNSSREVVFQFPPKPPAR